MDIINKILFILSVVIVGLIVIVVVVYIIRKRFKNLKQHIQNNPNNPNIMILNNSENIKKTINEKTYKEITISEDLIQNKIIPSFFKYLSSNNIILTQNSTHNSIYSSYFLFNFNNNNSVYYHIYHTLYTIVLDYTFDGVFSNSNITFKLSKRTFKYNNIKYIVKKSDLYDKSYIIERVEGKEEKKVKIK